MIFMPIAGWGFLGLALTPKPVIAAIISHLIFAVLIWGGCRLVGGSRTGVMSRFYLVTAAVYLAAALAEIAIFA